MYSLLIVDDEQVEREGIKYLVNKFKLNLKVFEAENGKKALEFIKSNHIDILFTDIKMPFMDGLDLSHHAKNIHPNMKIIIFSAFGEFDYAKKAIDNNVNKYILKPIDPDEFFNVMSQTVQMCSNEEEESKRVEKLMEGYNKGIAYEKEKLFIDILNGISVDENYLQILNENNIDLDENNYVMLFVDMKERFFDLKNGEFVSLLKKTINFEFEYLNLNEYQSIVFLKNLDVEADKYILEETGEKIIQAITLNHNHRVCLVFSNTVNKIKDFYEEHKKIEQLLDTSFFFDESVILFVDADFPYNFVSTEMIDNIIDDINGAFDSGDADYVAKGIEHLFNAFKSKGSFSQLYVKYVCAEIIKKIIKKIDKTDENSFKSNLEKIFAENSLIQLKENMFLLISALLQDEQVNPDAVGKRVIKNILEIIEQDYMKDLGLEYIAGKVYLTPTYLSYLFKRETGQSLIKFITLYRLNKAKELLLDTNMRIAVICEKVGYVKLSYFCAIFKNNFGMTPAKYRERKEFD